MNFILNTVSKPVAGKEAAKLIKAIQTGGHLANATALETIARIVKRHTPPNLACLLAVGRGNCPFPSETPVLPFSKPNHYLPNG